MGRRDEFGGGAGHGREINLTDDAVARGSAPTASSTVHLPPTPEALEHLHGLIERHREDTRNDKAQAARESDQDTKAKASPYGLGGNKALRKHLAEKHELHHEDAMEMERPHHYHRQWHTMGEYNPDGHSH